MLTQHASLAAGRWSTLSLLEQLGNVGSEVGRAARWQNKDKGRFEGAFARALELLDLTIADARWQGRCKELLRARELLGDSYCGGNAYQTTFADLERYFSFFAYAARSNR